MPLWFGEYFSGIHLFSSDRAARDDISSSAQVEYRNNASNGRLDYLDSLRGIAAALVVLHHLYQTSPFWPTLVRFSPLRVLINGRSSVIFFFVLSGLVLSYGIWRAGQPANFGIFVQRRLARICIPFLASGCIAILAMAALAPHVLPDTAITFNEMWPTPIDWRTALAHLTLTGTREANSVNSPSWSLVYEIRISLLLPLLCALYIRFPRLFFMAAAAAYIAVHAAMLALGISLVPFDADGWVGALLITAHFTTYFVISLFLARALMTRADWLERMPVHRKIILAVLGGGLLLIFRDDTAALGAVAIITLAMNTEGFRRVLRNRVLLWLGRISFSLYLTHMIVLQVVVRTLHGTVPLWVSLIAALVAVVPAAVIFFYVVEQPAHALSRRIGMRAKAPMAAAEAAVR